MSRRGHAGRVDANHAECVKALRSAGMMATSTAMLGNGFADIIVGYRGLNILLEIKSEGGRMTSDERQFHLTWAGQVAVANSPEEAVIAVVDHCKKMGAL